MLIRLGIIIAFLLNSGLVFASLAEDVIKGKSLSVLDPVFGTWLITHTSLNGDRIFSIITVGGNALIIAISTGLLGLWLATRKRWDQLVFLFLAVGGAAFLNLLLKLIFLRSRPAYPQGLLVVSGLSFPSGHAMISLAFYGAVAYLAFSILKNRWSKLLVAVAALAVSALIGFSRLYLGVHDLTDVLAGWAAGGLWLAICILGKVYIDFKNMGKLKSSPI